VKIRPQFSEQEVAARKVSFALLTLPAWPHSVSAIERRGMCSRPIYTVSGGMAAGSTTSPADIATWARCPARHPSGIRSLLKRSGNLAQISAPRYGSPHNRASPHPRPTLYLSGYYLHLGEALLLARRFFEARQIADRGLTLARELGERGVEAHILFVLGEVASESGELSTSDQLYQNARSLAIELDLRPLVAHCHLGLGKLYRRTGKREQAREHLTTATTMYREMDMRFWLEQAEAEIDEFGQS
jgi:tetratricopeptide (TPR) repeat protein